MLTYEQLVEDLESAVRQIVVLNEEALELNLLLKAIRLQRDDYRKKYHDLSQFMLTESEKLLT